MDKQELISRRDFFTKILTRHKEFPTQEPKPTVSTANANFFGFYENHFLGIDPNIIIGTSPNLHFHELTESSATSISSSVSDDLKVYGGRIIFGHEIKTPNMYSTELLSYLSATNGYVSFEGLTANSNLVGYVAYETVTTAIGATLMGISMADNIKKIRKGKMNRRTFLKNSALFTTGLFLTSDLYTSFLTTISARNNSTPELITHLNAIVADLHPEKMEIFFRNAMMAKKLDLLSTSLPKFQSKPNISYQVGSSHGSIEHFLAIGPELTTKIICLYPKEILQNVIDANGGLDTFCSTVLIPVRPNLTNPDANVKQVIVDQQLKSALEIKLGINH